jgi:hypothetical protein
VLAIECFLYGQKGKYTEFTIHKKDFVKIKLFKNKEHREFLEILYKYLSSCEGLEFELENKKTYMAIIANFRKGNVPDEQAIYFGKLLLTKIMLKIEEGINKK